YMLNSEERIFRSSRGGLDSSFPIPFFPGRMFSLHPASFFPDGGRRFALRRLPVKLPGISGNMGCCGGRTDMPPPCPGGMGLGKKNPPADAENAEKASGGGRGKECPFLFRRTPLLYHRKSGLQARKLDLSNFFGKFFPRKVNEAGKTVRICRRRGGGTRTG
ncbi:hypothetical protein, partial [Victivallis lenta]|uniref:hypothetical protein n=1 Tax=Victivallis lenta TaxID=2606640 RepID=UPI003AB348A1